MRLLALQLTLCMTQSLGNQIFHWCRRGCCSMLGRLSIALGVKAMDARRATFPCSRRCSMCMFPRRLLVPLWFAWLQLLRFTSKTLGLGRPSNWLRLCRPRSSRAGSPHHTEPMIVRLPMSLLRVCQRRGDNGVDHLVAPPSLVRRWITLVAFRGSSDAGFIRVLFIVRIGGGTVTVHDAVRVMGLWYRLLLGLLFRLWFRCRW
mmetsp:Transcript_7543/g.13594  ORF Transcript_7543/g.13594 Transcript_7543/m.13594 type:complete len:204 (-) Transcript_7543:3119-3730(-)